MSDEDEVAKAFFDTMLYGRGFTRITSEGIKHIPRSEVMTEWEELNEGAWRKGHEVSRSQKAAEISQPEKLSAASPLQIANRRLVRLKHQPHCHVPDGGSECSCRDDVVP